jgi:type VI secretion system protein ImpM
MQTLLLTGHDALGERWKECYLKTPIWRFALSAGLCGPQTVAGVVMPSVDRVGRYFPFCIIAQTDGSAVTAYLTLQPTFAALEDVALTMLDDGASVPQLENMLATLPKPQHASPPDTRLNDQFKNAPSIWTAVIAHKEHVLLNDALPQGTVQARALFDLQDPYWHPLH